MSHNLIAHNLHFSFNNPSFGYKCNVLCRILFGFFFLWVVFKELCLSIFFNAARLWHYCVCRSSTPFAQRAGSCVVGRRESCHSAMGDPRNWSKCWAISKVLFIFLLNYFLSKLTRTIHRISTKSISIYFSPLLLSLSLSLSLSLVCWFYLFYIYLFLVDVAQLTTLSR